MAYDPYKGLQNIYNAKVAYGNATTDEERKKQQEIANRERNEMAGQGYGNLAAAASANGADAAAVKKLMNNYAKKDKTATRGYLYSLGQKHGMTSSDVDKIIGWDNDTGQLSLGGKVVGTPDAVVDGVSYWSDTSILDNAFNDYISRSGTTASDSQLSSQNSAGVKNKIDELWGLQTSDHNSNNLLWKQEYDDLKNTNPFTTDEAKSILAKYDLAGLQGRDNAAAAGSASNGGNIDSYAAANALRQQAALVNQGQQVVLESYQKKLDNARALLEGLGVQQQNSYTSMQNTINQQQTEAQRLFDNDQTALNNETERMRVQAEVSGYTPTEWSIQNDAFLKNFIDKNGKLKEEYNDTDFQELINNAKANGNAELANKYAILRGLKIFGNFSEYGKYLNQGDVAYVQPQRTADYDLTKQQIESAESIAKGENDTSLALADKEATSAINQINAKTQGEKEIIQETAKYGSGEKSVDVIDLSDYVGKIKANENVYGVDEYGVGLLNKLLEYARTTYNNTSLLSMEELLNKAVDFSAECHTDKAQLEKVFDSLGIKISLDDIEDRDSNDWTKGVKWKTTSK